MANRDWACLAAVAFLLVACGSSGATPTSGPTTASDASRPGPPATRRQIARCTLGHGKVVAVDHDAVVFTRPHQVAGGGPPGSARPGVIVLGCLIRNQRPVQLALTSDLGHVVLNRATVAFATSEVNGIDTINAEVTVADIQRRRQLFRVPAGHTAIAPTAVIVDALAVTKAGTVAWIQHGGSGESPGYSVHAASTRQADDHQLSSGADIVPRSLRVNHSLVSWVQGGRRRYASLGPSS